LQLRRNRGASSPPSRQDAIATLAEGEGFGASMDGFPEPFFIFPHREVVWMLLAQL
jgi:hypothetical protein